MEIRVLSFSSVFNNFYYSWFIVIIWFGFWGSNPGPHTCDSQKILLLSYSSSLFYSVSNQKEKPVMWTWVFLFWEHVDFYYFLTYVQLILSFFVFNMKVTKGEKKKGGKMLLTLKYYLEVTWAWGMKFESMSRDQQSGYLTLCLHFCDHK